jgi:4-methylaminobutanoate oxidase (formaldehyde-forming)
MSKFIVQGPDACVLLGRLSCNQVDVAPGTIVYTQWVNEAGGFEADLTVTRLEPDKFLVVCGENAPGHTEMRMRRHIGPNEFVTILDTTYATTQINIHGPKSRALMQKVSYADMSDLAFPYLSAKEIDIGYASVLAIRVTYIGELGWELHVPTVHAVQVYDQLVDQGEQFGLRHAGLQTLSSLRLEKAYRDFGVDVDNTDNPIEAGLGFAVKLDKEGGFIGRDALAEIKARGIPCNRMIQFLLQDPEPLLYGNELIYLNGEEVGYMQIGAYGHTLGAAVGIGFARTEQPLSAKIVNAGSWEIDIAGTRIKATASVKPLYDPTMERIKC